MMRFAVVLVGALALAGVAHGQTTSGAADIPAPPDVAAPPADAVKTASGLATKVLEPGTGSRRATEEEFVTVHYTGWTTDGKMFDSSVPRGAPNTFPLSKTVKGWSEAVRMMAIGEKRRMWIPEAIGYAGAQGRPKGMLVFDVELLDIVPSPQVPPPDVAAPPADAKFTESGIAYKILKVGPSGAAPKPTRNSRVTVNYSGWTTDGKLFDSSVMRGQPATFALTDVIEGWTEGVQLLSPGDRARFWIPENLAYKGQGGMPAGMLVFDIELIKSEVMQ